MHFKSQIYFLLYNIFVCLTACLPAIVPGSTMARTPVFSHNKDNRIQFTKLSFLGKFMYCTMVLLFKPGMHDQRPCMSGFLKLLWFACWYVCLCMCACVSTPRALITSGVVWCDIGCVRSVKQVLWLFPAFNYLYDTYHC